MNHRLSQTARNFEHPKTGSMTQFKLDMMNYESSRIHGEAPDNLLAVEKVTLLRINRWLMQSDVLSPLAPVTSVRSDTFAIELWRESCAEISVLSNAWIELTVKRVR